MKKILILETAAFKGGAGGGSYIQAEYYTKLLRQKGYRVELFKGEAQESQRMRVWRVVKKIRENDYVLGFGTRLLDYYLQWMCLILGKKGIFCIDTIIVPLSIIEDHFKRKIFLTRNIFSFIKKFLYDNLIINISVPKLNLVNLASCAYVAEKTKDTQMKTFTDRYVFPRVELLNEVYQRKGSGVKKVLYYGHLYRGRGVLDLVKACRMLWEKGYDFKLFLLGWPVDNLTKLALHRDLKKNGGDNIVLREKITNTQKYIKSANMVVLPFRYPCAFQPPYTIIEPMALGVPVITTDVGSHCEWIKDGETGLICQRENPEDLAEKIETVFKDKKLVERITNGAFRLLQKKYKAIDILLDTLDMISSNMTVITHVFFIGCCTFNFIFGYFLSDALL